MSDESLKPPENSLNPTHQYAGPNLSETSLDQHPIDSTNRPGDELNTDNPPGFQLLRVLGRGGMGVVYLALQQELNRHVALKMLHLGRGNASGIERFLSEAEILARLRHPHLVQVFSAGTHLGVPFFVMEYVEGGTLADQLESPLPPSDAAGFVRQVAQAVGYCHQNGIVHRDLKPSNILLCNGQPRVSDFGLAKRFEDTAEGPTHTGAVLGTPNYMPPEQAAGKARNARPPADVYALGAILYRCLTGRPPHQAPTTHETLRQVVECEPLPPRQLQPGVPRDLETICLKCLEKDPAKRYPTANELADDLDRWLTGRPILARPAGPLERCWKWVRRNRAVAIGSVAVLASLLLGTVVSLIFAVQAMRNAEYAQDREQAANVSAELARKNEAAARQSEQLARDHRQNADEQAKLALQRLEDGRVILARGILRTVGRKDLQQPDPQELEAFRDLGRLTDPEAITRLFREIVHDPAIAARVRGRAEWLAVAGIGTDPDLRRRVTEDLRPVLHDEKADPHCRRAAALLLTELDACEPADASLAFGMILHLFVGWFDDRSITPIGMTPGQMEDTARGLVRLARRVPADRVPDTLQKATIAIASERVSFAAVRVELAEAVAVLIEQLPAPARPAARLRVINTLVAHLSKGDAVGPHTAVALAQALGRFRSDWPADVSKKLWSAVAKAYGEAVGRENPPRYCEDIVLRLLDEAPPEERGPAAIAAFDALLRKLNTPTTGAEGFQFQALARLAPRLPDNLASDRCSKALIVLDGLYRAGYGLAQPGSHRHQLLSDLRPLVDRIDARTKMSVPNLAASLSKPIEEGGISSRVQDLLLEAAEVLSWKRPELDEQLGPVVIRQLEAALVGNNALALQNSVRVIDGEEVPVLRFLLDRLLPTLPEENRRETVGAIVKGALVRLAELKPNELPLAGKYALLLSFFRAGLKVEDYRERANATWDVLVQMPLNQDWNAANNRLAGLAELAEWVSPDRAGKLPTFGLELLPWLADDLNSGLNFDWKPLEAVVANTRNPRLAEAALNKLLTHWERVARSDTRSWFSMKAVPTLIAALSEADRPAARTRALAAFLVSQERGSSRKYLSEVYTRELAKLLAEMPAAEATAFTRQLVASALRPDANATPLDLEFRVVAIEPLRRFIPPEDLRKEAARFTQEMLAKANGPPSWTTAINIQRVSNLIVAELPQDERRALLRPVLLVLLDGVATLNRQNDHWKHVSDLLKRMLPAVDTEDLRTLLRHPYCILEIREVVLAELRKRFPGPERDPHGWLPKLPPEMEPGRFPFPQWGGK